MRVVRGRCTRHDGDSPTDRVRLWARGVSYNLRGGRGLRRCVATTGAGRGLPQPCCNRVAARAEVGEGLLVDELSSRAIGAAREALECFRNGPAYEVLDADRDKFQVVYPLSAHVMEQVSAALILIDAELCYPAESNARSAFQHAVTAQWVVLTEGGEDQVLAEMKRTHSTTVEDFSLSVDLPDELLSVIGDRPKSQGPARDFWWMCSRFSNDKALYVMFRRLSDSVHPSLRTFNEHLQADDARGVFALSARSSPEPEPDLLISLTIAAMLALSAVEGLRRGQTRMPAIRGIADRWQVPVDLRGDDLLADAGDGNQHG